MKKYIEYRINKVEIQAREEFGDWEDIAKWEGKSLIFGKTLKEVLNKLKYWFEEVVLIKEDEEI